MRLHHLALSNFRLFDRLDLELPGGVVMLLGDNAQGKTSLLEAVFFLAAFTSFQTSQDSQVVRFGSREGDLAVGRITAGFESAGRRHTLELRLILQGEGAGRLRKEILLDGVKQRAAAAVGRFNAVVFIPQMTRIIDNGPDERRRYLNMTLSQAVPGYAEDLTRYSQALLRRNALLRTLAAEGGPEDQLDYWDEQLSLHGSRLAGARAQAVGEMRLLARPVHADLTDGSEQFELEYLPTFALEPGASPADLQEAYRKRAHAARRNDLLRGVTTIGPHRDDLRFSVNGRSLADFGSRGQVRTALQSLKLGELLWMKQRTGEMPVLLLDETLAELDEHRRYGLLAAVELCDQVLLTTTDLDLFTPAFLSRSRLWRVSAGTVDTG